MHEFAVLCVYLLDHMDASDLCVDFEIQVDIQALAHAVELTRQGAIDSLRFAKGDLFQAFQVVERFTYLISPSPKFLIFES